MRITSLPTYNKNLSEALRWEMVKQQRDKLLQKCDWTQLPDAILTDAERTAWQDYRQTLRDIPQDFINPDDVIFPDPPTGV